MLEAVASLNIRADTLRDVRLVADTESIPIHDSFNAGKICEIPILYFNMCTVSIAMLTFKCFQI